MSRAALFSYSEVAVNPERGQLTCSYQLGDDTFTERITIPGVDPGCWGREGVEGAVRWVHLLAGVSYYKAAAPERIDLGGLPASGADLGFLRSFYVDGLGELAYRNGLDLSGLDLSGESEPAGARAATAEPTAGPAAASQARPMRPLVPFGGGIDSIVTTELVRRTAGDGSTALFILHKPGDRYAAIEAPAAVAGLPILRAEREIDPRILRSAELGYINGHVPVTGILSAIAVLTAILHGRDAVVMSNESSASSGNLVVNGRMVNHQWSKSIDFERGFRAALSRAGVPVAYFSLLRPASELWVAKRFAALADYHPVFRSCNRAFYADPALRLDHWCGECDKCCFVDLVLAPFVAAGALEAIFGRNEPLRNPALAGRFRALLATSSSPKPFDCVGDITECRTALRMAATQPGRSEDPLVRLLLGELPEGEPDASARLLGLHGPHFIPDAYAPSDLLV